jgi:hypothetical protein
MGQRLTSAAAARWRSSDEGEGDAAWRGSLGQGGAMRPARRGSEVVRRGCPWWPAVAE